MQKIISLYQRNYDGDRLVRDEVVPGAEWVLAGEGMPTRKYDGTSTMVRDGRLFKRYELKPGKVPPAGFEGAQGVDDMTGKQPGWVPVGDGPEDQYHREAFAVGARPHPPADGTYELLGPKIQGNVEAWPIHQLLRHADAEILADAPRDFEGLRAYFSTHDIEGIVWHHPDGRMVKIKGKDFGVKRARAAVPA